MSPFHRHCILECFIISKSPPPYTLKCYSLICLNYNISVEEFCRHHANANISSLETSLNLWFFSL